MFNLLFLSSIVLIVLNGAEGCTEVSDLSQVNAAEKAALFIYCGSSDCATCIGPAKQSFEKNCNQYKATCFCHSFDDKTKGGSVGAQACKANTYALIVTFKKGSVLKTWNHKECPSGEQIDETFTSLRDK
ncbi:hypothetical protein LSTR_LSTR009274 [Laodelphax striatellus]|uniref:Thioredoxin domain-containing protein n=1 Tax=Laodelphax striatellus TaxID=195883 RepID=A0A482X4J3_LAOST|nr:hypothetical protein LSTR_LSTR009274 [Laodelphax striatellus]